MVQQQQQQQVQMQCSTALLVPGDCSLQTQATLACLPLFCRSFDWIIQDCPRTRSHKAQW
uniref:Uncharacterized protein n=1 Tax=Oryza brachyantha TaxID=4533 RepID=J3NCC5_ORYBR